MLGLDLARISSDAVDIAQSVPIETELARRGIRLRRQGVENWLDRARYAVGLIASLSTSRSKSGTAAGATRAVTLSTLFSTSTPANS